MRLRALGEGGKLTQPLCLVVFFLLLCFSLLNLKCTIPTSRDTLRKVALDLVWTLQIWSSGWE